MRVTAIEKPETPLARVLREQGRFKGWLAERMGISRPRLSRLLSGERVMTVVEAQRAAEALGVPVTTLMEGPNGDA